MVSRTPSERSKAKGDLWSSIPTTSRSLDVGAKFCPEADTAGLSWLESPMDRPPEGRPTLRTTSGKDRMGLPGEGVLHMSSLGTILLGWAWPEGTTLVCLTRHHKPAFPRRPPPTLRRKHLSLSFDDGRLPPYSLLSGENWGPATLRGHGDRCLKLLVGGGKAKRGEFPWTSSTRGMVSYGAAPKELGKPLPRGLRAYNTGPLTWDGLAWSGPCTIGCFLPEQGPDGSASRLSPDRPPKT